MNSVKDRSVALLLTGDLLDRFQIIGEVSSVAYNLRREFLYHYSFVVGKTGDFSAVSASSRAEAMELLDEVGNADVADLFTAKRFMVHFQLKKQVDSVEEPLPVDLEGFGEETYDMLCERVYPVYNKALLSKLRFEN